MARVIAYYDVVGDGVTRTDGVPVIRLADRRAHLPLHRPGTHRDRAGVDLSTHIFQKTTHKDRLAKNRDGLAERTTRRVPIKLAGLCPSPLALLEQVGRARPAAALAVEASTDQHAVGVELDGGAELLALARVLDGEQIGR